MIRKTPLKRSTKPIKRSGLPLKRSLVRRSATKKRKVSTPEKLMKKKLWELCRIIIRNIYGNTCYTCGKTELQGSNLHTGHFIPSSICGANLRFDLRNLRPQCYRCNINLGGNGTAFYHRLVDDCGQAYVDKLFQDKKIVIKADIHFFNSKIEEYQAICDKNGFKSIPKPAPKVIHTDSISDIDYEPW